MHVKSEEVCADHVEDFNTKFDTSSYEVKRLLHIGKSKKVIRIMKYDLGGRIMKQFVALRQKTYSYLTD